MLDIKKWEKYDIIYLILSITLSAVIINIILINQNGLVSKTLLFIIISILLFYVIKYIYEFKKEKFEGQELNTRLNTRDEIKSINNHNHKYYNEHYKKYSKDGVYPTISNKLSGEPVEKSYDTKSIYSDTKQDYAIKMDKDNYENQNNNRQYKDHYENQNTSDEEHHHTSEEEHRHTSEEEHRHTSEEEHRRIYHTSDKDQHRRKVPTYKPYDTPININISYNTRNSTNTDDIVNIKERFSKPDESSHVFHNNIPAPETINNKINNEINNKNINLNKQNSNNKYYRPADSNCSGSNCSPKPWGKNNKIYSGNSYEYISANIPPDNFEKCMKGNGVRKDMVCPLSINQNWSKWNPRYLSGDDHNDSMVK